MHTVCVCMCLCVCVCVCWGRADMRHKQRGDGVRAQYRSSRACSSDTPPIHSRVSPPRLAPDLGAPPPTHKRTHTCSTVLRLRAVHASICRPRPVRGSGGVSGVSGGSGRAPPPIDTTCKDNGRAYRHPLVTARRGYPHFSMYVALLFRSPTTTYSPPRPPPSPPPPPHPYPYPKLPPVSMAAHKLLAGQRELPTRPPTRPPT